MSTCDHGTTTPIPGKAGVGRSCACKSCCVDELAVNPFLALRVAYGMLLGEDDFQTLMGNARGKQMLHAAWLHGSGVVWGLDVCVEGIRVLRVSAGLAVDGLGRELCREVSWCADVRDWLAGQDLPEQEPDCSTFTVRACVVAEFDCCPTAPVPTLADPCDVTRRHDDDSRIVETSRIVLRLGDCPCPPRPYHRVRVLLGIDEVGSDDVAGQQAFEARCAVAAADPGTRPARLLTEFRRMAALDVTELRPATEEGASYPLLFPVLDDAAGVVLACVEIDVRDTDGCREITEVRPDVSCRTALLPTATIQELTCGLAPGLLDVAVPDAAGPRVIPDSLEWSADGRELSVATTLALHPGTVKPRAVRMTSLPADGDDGWVDEDIYRVRWDSARCRIVVILADRPVNDIVRLIFSGTGPAPMLGADPPRPLAGVVGGPPVGPDDGYDAVLTVENPITNRRTEP